MQSRQLLARVLARALPFAVFGALVVGNLDTDPDELADTDCYQRLVRVQHLRDSGGWFDPVLPRSNAPFGEVSHWTRPFDALLLAGAFVGTLVADFATALHWWGLLLSPLLLLLLVAVTPWAVRPILPRAHALFLQVLLLTRPGVLAYCGPGRADHHALLLFLFVVALGLALRFRARAAGALCALMVWVSLESFLVVAFLVATLGTAWLARARPIRGFFDAFLVGLTVALPLERPPAGLLDVAYDRLSIVHWTLALLMALFWRIKPRDAARLPAAGAGLAGVAGAMALLFPRFFLGPYADVDPWVRAWETGVREAQPLLAADSWALIVFRLQSLPGLLLFARFPRTNRAEWTVVATGLAVFLPFYFWRGRWTHYGEVLLCVCLAELFFRAVDGLHRRLARAPAYACDVALALAIVLLGNLAIVFVPGAPDPRALCPLRPVARALGERAPAVVLAHENFGPELMYRTHHAVVATTYHRNAAGLKDVHRFFDARDDAEARAVAEARGAGFVLVCRTGRAAPFRDRLATGAPPPWLKETRLPPAAARHFRLYEVLLQRR